MNLINIFSTKASSSKKLDVAQRPRSKSVSKSSVKSQASSKTSTTTKRLVVQSAAPKMIGHFTQLIWAQSPRVGCGMVHYMDGKFNAYLLACNYVYGNVLKHSVYDSGPSGSACKTEVVNGLCKNTE